MADESKKQVDIKNAGVIKRDEYVKVLEKIIEEGGCPFCEGNLMRHHREPILSKGKHWLVTKNAWPYEGAKHHFLLISNTHIESIEDASPDVWSELHEHWNKLQNKFQLEGATLFIRSGDTKMTGASVCHLHAQIVAGKPRGDDSSAITALIGFK